MIIPSILSLVLSFLIGACGDEDSRAVEAAKWLTSYYETNPPNLEWVSINITVDGKGQVIVDVLVPDKGQVSLIKSRPRIEQAYIVSMACPPKTSEVRTIINTSQVVWVNLLEKTSNGLFKQITGSSCKR
jgi:hypothetical protein